MKYIKYIIMSVISALACSCSDDAPSEIVNLGKCKAEVVNLTPESFGIKVDLENWDIYDEILVKIQVANGDKYNTESVGPEYSIAFFTYDPYGNTSEILPGKTYQYKVVGLLNDLQYNIDCELVTDTVTTPTMEEYINENFGACVMEQSVLTHNSAFITAKLPDGVDFGAIKAVYSTSPDFTGAIEVEENNKTGQHASFYLTDLQANTKYYVKVHGNFKIGDHYFIDYDLQLSPDNFTTLSEGQITSDARCCVAH